MKTLNTIQTIAKIAKIIGLVVFIVSIVGGAFCILGIISLALIPDGISLGGVTIYGLVKKSADLSLGACYTAMAAGAVTCAGVAVTAKLAEIYFKNELEAGTPFTFEGAKELLRLGVCMICISVGTSTISMIILAVMRHFFSDVDKLNFSNALPVGLGVMFIFLSLICKYGAEVIQQKQQDA